LPEAGSCQFAECGAGLTELLCRARERSVAVRKRLGDLGGDDVDDFVIERPLNLRRERSVEAGPTPFG
jgi:hypothetical protein